MKLQAAEYLQSELPERLLVLFSRIRKVFVSLTPKKILSEDTLYKWQFMKKFMPELYMQHTQVNYANCVFCANLVKSRCHKHCLKCSIGTYIKCSPPLPGEIFKEPVSSNITANFSVPWYYKETCDHFVRLPGNRYYKNLITMLSTIGIYNFEVLEGLEKGLTAGLKPCHVCATVNYGLYQKCIRQGDYDTSSPCHKIAAELKDVYQEQASSKKTSIEKAAV